MKEQRYYISKLYFFRRPQLSVFPLRSIVCSIVFCVTSFIFSSQSHAQDDNDSVELSTDSSYTSVPGEYQNKAGKFSDEAIFRGVPDTTVARMKQEKEFAYANDPAYWVKKEKTYKKGFLDYVFDFFQSDVVRWMFYLFVAGLIIFVLYRIIIVNDLFVIYASRKKKQSAEDTIATDIDPSIIDQRITEAIDQKEYNSAVRYLYIKTLYALNDKKWIQFHAQATNSEYVKQMTHHKSINDFRFLTRVYEFAWYGRFEITEQQFSVVHHNFQKFQATL